MRKSLIILCILIMAFSLFGISAQEDFSKIGLRNRAAGLQAVYNYLQSIGKEDCVKGWWRFEIASGNLPDELGVNNLTPAGTPTYQQPDYLGLGRAITFNGTTDYFSITNAAQTGLNLGINDALILVVAKVSTDVTSARPFVAKYVDDNYRYDFYIDVTTGKLRWRIGDDTNSAGLISDNAHNDNKFHLFQANLDRDSVVGMDVFVDGQSDLAVKTNPTAVGDLDNVADFNVGLLAAAFYMKGSVAEIMFISASDLSDILTDAFALFAYNQALGYPLNLPKKIN